MKKTKLVSEIRLALEKGLKENGHTKMGKIQVECNGNKISIRGQVKTYYQKQMVITVVKQIGGVFFEISDDVTVV